MPSKQTTENLAYHASRLLLLILLCGKPRNTTSEKLPGIEGRTLLAKFDFFIRYPFYLRCAANILDKKVSDEDLGLATTAEEYSIESQMVRFFYGPWDHIYYLVLAYLIGKELINVEKSDGRGTEIFRLTRKGWNVAKSIMDDPIYTDLASRADTAYHLFNAYNGNRLKEFIYENFPEVVGRKIGAQI